MSEKASTLIVISANQHEFVHTFVPPLEEDKAFAANLEDGNKAWQMSGLDARDGLIRSISYFGHRGRGEAFYESSKKLGESLERQVIVTALSPKPRN